MSTDLSAIVSRLETVTSRLESLASAKSTADVTSTEGSSESVEELDCVLEKGKFKTYLELSQKLGDEIADHAKLVNEVFKLMREAIKNASQYQPPSQSVMSEVMKPLSNKVAQVIKYAEDRRASKSFNNLMTVKEGIGFAGWVTVSPKPAPYVKECYDQALFYANRVIKEFKGTNENQVNWAKSYYGGILELQEYVKKNHTTGLVWNKTGPPYPAPSAGPPPPPPPAIQPPETVPASSSKDTDSQRANLFASINKGADITQGLRKVTDSMKTHKNPELRASSVVKSVESKGAPKSAPKYGTAVGKSKPPVLALQGKKWVVENQDNKNDLAVTDTQAKQSVYVFKCTKSTLKVSGKVNSIILDNCKRMALCFDNVISSAEVINSQGVQIQVLGQCPTISIDKTDGCQVFLSKDSLKCEIISAKSSEMNICIPPKDGKGDFIERPVPEQFKTVWNGTALITECTDITS